MRISASTLQEMVRVAFDRSIIFTLSIKHLKNDHLGNLACFIISRYVERLEIGNEWWERLPGPEIAILLR